MHTYCSIRAYDLMHNNAHRHTATQQSNPSRRTVVTKWLQTVPLAPFNFHAAVGLLCNFTASISVFPPECCRQTEDLDLWNAKQSFLDFVPSGNLTACLCMQSVSMPPSIHLPFWKVNWLSVACCTWVTPAWACVCVWFIMVTYASFFTVGY